MIDIAPKALRFARLAAEQQAAFSSDPEIAVIEQQEKSFRRMHASDRVQRYVGISDSTAEFCIRVMTALLEEPGRFRSSGGWDGNDFAFLQSAASSLREQLARANARKL